MPNKIITNEQINKRDYWVEEISSLSGRFGVDAEKVEAKLANEVRAEGISTLLGHLRLCGAIPERYSHDSSEEKLYSKYTDVVIHESYSHSGFTSVVLKERAGVADVECVAENYSFVADAKAFRLSRTAKNQKDFKVQAMDGWKHGKPFAMVVCPVYQLPPRKSQIYQQAAARSVFVATYTHLAVLATYASTSSPACAIELLHELFRCVEAMNPTESATEYWQAVNRTMLDYDDSIQDIWEIEKKAVIEAIHVSRVEALKFLAKERERIMQLSKKDAINEVLKTSKISNKVNAIESVCDNGLLGVA